MSEGLQCPKCHEPLSLIQMRLDEALEDAAAEHRYVAGLRKEINDLKVWHAAEKLELTNALEEKGPALCRTLGCLRPALVLCAEHQPHSEGEPSPTARFLQLGPQDQVVLESERPLSLAQLEQLKDNFKEFTGTRRPIVLDRGIRVAYVLHFISGLDGEGI